MNGARIKYISSMLIFGSMGIFVRILPFSSSQIALARGGIGCLFLIGMMLLFRRDFSLSRIRKDLWILLASGIAIGVNWILLFQSYRYTSISNATICYYMAPVLVVLLAPWVLKEKLTVRKTCCIAAALLGIVLISGTGEQKAGDMAGILFGLGAAVFYAAIILLNQFPDQVTNPERTIVQLAAGAVVLLPYVLFTSSFEDITVTWTNIWILLIVGVVHTGAAYFLYFSGLHELKGQTAALFSYIDPLTAIMLSALLLKEPLGIMQIAGGCLILGSTFAIELMPGKTTKT